MYLGTDISTQNFGDLSWCILELLPHVCYTSLMRYVALSHSVKTAYGDHIRDRTQGSPCRCQLPKLVLS